MDVLTGAAIAKLAFDEVIKSGAGELAKKAVGGAIEQLRSAIKARFAAENAKAETAIAMIESSADSTTAEAKTAALTKLSVYLEDEMDDAPFAQTLQQLAQQVINIQNQSISDREYNNYGRDQINIENVTGNQKIGGT